MLSEKAKSRAQQRFFGMVRSAQKGEMKNPSSEVSQTASSMSKSDVKKMASTKHKGLPEKKDIQERLGGKGYKPYTSLTGKKVSGDWEDSDRGAGNKATRRAGGEVKAKSPTYKAHVINKGKKKVDPKKNPVVEEKNKGRHPRDQKELDRAQEYLKKNPNFGKERGVKEDYYRGTGEKVVSRTKKWMDKKGQKGAPGLDAMKARAAEHKAKRGVKEEVVDEGKKKGLWDNIHAKRKRGEAPAKKGDKDYPKTLNVEGAAWTKKSGKSESGGLNEKGRKSYERENPGSDLKAPQPEGGSRKKSFCARMGGMKKKLTSSKTANDPDSRINKSLRKWKCNEGVMDVVKRYRNKHDEKKPQKAQDAGAKARRSMQRREYASKVSGSTDNVPDNLRDHKTWGEFKKHI